MSSALRFPIHVVYGGANLFNADTPLKLGKIALATVSAYAPNTREFASAFGLDEGEPAASIYRKTVDKLAKEPVEDFRIDFEDGYGFRPDDEEDEDAIRASSELAKAFSNDTLPPFCGFRIKSLASETQGRGLRTLNLFLDNLLTQTDGRIPTNFVVTLPKVSHRREVRVLCKKLGRVEKEAGMDPGAIGVEIMIETPDAVIDRKGRFAPARLVKAARGRCGSAHFGAFDYTSALGISGTHQHLRHAACNFARQVMLTTLSPLGTRVVDSVTTQMPVAIHRDESLTEQQKDENRESIINGWREHFANVTASMSNGFYQSWDLHPNQLVARYAAVYAFFLRSVETDGQRLRTFIEKATKASMTGSTFDDAASANGLLNFFRMGLDCGAFSEEEVDESTGISGERLRGYSFSG